MVRCKATTIRWNIMRMDTRSFLHALTGGSRDWRRLREGPIHPKKGTHLCTEPPSRWVGRFCARGDVILLALTLTGYAGFSSYDLLGAPSGISLKPDKWSILHSYSMPTKPSAEGNGWAFDFPKGSNCKVKEGCPGVHYVTTPYTKNIAYGAKLVIEGEIVADPGVSFNYQPEKSNTCTTPATARAFIQKHNDDLYAANGRFWANPVAIPMAPGKFSGDRPLRYRQLVERGR